MEEQDKFSMAQIAWAWNKALRGHVIDGKIGPTWDSYSFEAFKEALLQVPASVEGYPVGLKPENPIAFPK